MQKILSSILAAVTLASTLIIAAPADARNRAFIRQGQGVHAFQGHRNFANRGAYIGRYSGWNRGRGYGGRGYYGNRGGRYYGYGGRRYYGYGGRRDYGYDNGDAVGAGIAGLAVGALLGSALSHRSHAATGSCAARFKSYNRATGTYLGYDGLRHPCP